MDPGINKSRYKRNSFAWIKVFNDLNHKLAITYYKQIYFSKKREVVPDLAPMLWNSFGTIAALLQEIINIYPAINPPTLTAVQSNR